MKIVVVNEGLAYPPNAGNRIRTLNLLLPLAGRHDITYLCRGVEDRSETEPAIQFYADHGIRVRMTSDYPPRKAGIAFYARLATNLLSPLPFSVATHNSPLVRREILRIVANEAVDIWQFETPLYADTLRHTDQRRVIMAHNVESLIWQRHYEAARHPLARFYMRRQWHKYERYERAVLNQASRVVAVSDEDARLFKTRFGVDRVTVVDNGVDVGHFADVAKQREPQPHQLLFLGSLDWRPNIDSIDLLLNRIFPAVHAVEPRTTLRIVGRNPSPALVRQIRATPAVELHADVPDVRPFLKHAALMAVPLRIGGGSRLKILEAAAGALPVVSTRVGSEGLAFEHNRDMLIVDDVEGMPRAILECLRAPEAAAQRACNALNLVRERYNWPPLAARLERVWIETASSPT